MLRRCLIRAWEQAEISRLAQVPFVVYARYGHSSPSGYITPHCHSARPVAHPFAWCPGTAARPLGTGNRRYAKWPPLEYQQRLQVCFPSADASYAHPAPLLHWWMAHLGWGMCTRLPPGTENLKHPAKMLGECAKNREKPCENDRKIKSLQGGI